MANSRDTQRKNINKQVEFYQVYLLKTTICNLLFTGSEKSMENFTNRFEIIFLLIFYWNLYHKVNRREINYNRHGS